MTISRLRSASRVATQHIRLPLHNSAYPFAQWTDSHCCLEPIAKLPAGITIYFSDCSVSWPFLTNHLLIDALGRRGRVQRWSAYHQYVTASVWPVKTAVTAFISRTIGARNGDVRVRRERSARHRRSPCTNQRDSKDKETNFFITYVCLINAILYINISVPICSIFISVFSDFFRFPALFIRHNCNIEPPRAKRFAETKLRPPQSPVPTAAARFRQTAHGVAFAPRPHGGRGARGKASRGEPAFPTPARIVGPQYACVRPSACPKTGRLARRRPRTVRQTATLKKRRNRTPKSFGETQGLMPPVPSAYRNHNVAAREPAAATVAGGGAVSGGLPIPAGKRWRPHSVNWIVPVRSRCIHTPPSCDGARSGSRVKTACPPQRSATSRQSGTVRPEAGRCRTLCGSKESKCSNDAFRRLQWHTKSLIFSKTS